MRIRKGYCNALQLSSVTPPLASSPDLVSSIAHQPPWPTTPTPTFPSQKLHRLSDSGSNGGNDYFSPPPVMISRTNVPNTGIGTGEKRITVDSVEKMTTAVCESSISTETSSSSSVSSSLSTYGWWCEEEKVFPLKKRRMGLEKFITQEFDEKENGKKESVVANYKSRIKICHKKGKDYDDNYSNNTRIGKSLRCCRKNGKGWRCSRERAEGCEFCEHHIKLRDWEVSRNSDNGGDGEKEFRVGSKKKKRTMLISRILDRTMPLVANTSF
ncbi:uncharacterized protein LOC105646558 isoform X2 [Jatropha curcas]|uniref:uncharacterized protein LOC105646558 isoform X2 n=1 Tax=Jatropha curcas TaxID=180498 RepID=UPI0005FB362C|nr:uncharacterized protein LOC105646558 isoform X2 [Jatropha curcas]